VDRAQLEQWAADEEVALAKAEAEWEPRGETLTGAEYDAKRRAEGYR
jgi:hypothetical protein